MAKKFTWKLWLRPNLLTKDVENDYVAEVSTTGKTLHNADIARIMKDEGSELQYETLLDIFNHGDRLRREKLQEGYSVQTGVCHITPRVTGNWEGATPHFNPEAHKITCDMSPATELRHTLEEVGVEVLGVKESGARIGLVTNAYTGKTNGTITPDGDIIIEGEKIKIAPAGEDGLGVFFVDANGSTYTLTHPLTQNDPKKVVCRVPALAPGTYTLQIVTRYSNGTTVLKLPRTLVYEQPLTVS